MFFVCYCHTNKSQPLTLFAERYSVTKNNLLNKILETNSRSRNKRFVKNICFRINFIHQLFLNIFCKEEKTSTNENHLKIYYLLSLKEKKTSLRRISIQTRKPSGHNDDMWQQPYNNEGTAWQFWLQPYYNLTTTWRQPDYNLTTTWLQPDYSLTTTWLQPDFIPICCYSFTLFLH